YIFGSAALFFCKEEWTTSTREVIWIDLLFIAFISTAFYTDVFHLDDLDWPLSRIEEQRRQTDRQNIGIQVGGDDAQWPEDKDAMRENESQMDSNVVDQSDAKEEIERTDDRYSNHSEQIHADDGLINTDSKIDHDNDEKEPLHTDFHGFDETSENGIGQKDENVLTEKSYVNRDVDGSENVKESTGVSDDAIDDCNFEKGEYTAVVTVPDHIPEHGEDDGTEDGDTVINQFTGDDGELQEDEQPNHTHEEQQEKDAHISDGNDIYT
ncbi:hypothetical protein X801_02946, partial [Opisthorchis viverrini]